MYKIIVRAGKDLDAIDSMVEKYYRGWPIETYSLKGVRNVEEIISTARSLAREYKYLFLLLGRKDAGDKRILYGWRNLAVKVIDKARIRNTRLEELAWRFEEARALQRLLVSYNNNRYLLGEPINPVIKDPMPYNDLFMLNIPSKISHIIGLKPGYYLLLRDLGGRHKVLSEGRIIGEIHFSERIITPKYHGEEEPKPLDPYRIMSDNTRYLETEEKIVLNFMRKFQDKFDYYIIPWSGGKDSTTSLYLALKTYGSRRVYAVYVHLDTDLPYNIEYIEETAKRIGLHNLVIVERSLKKLLPRYGFPTHDNRWCTGVKIDGLHSVYREICGRDECLIISGDRDVESEKRGSRPPVLAERVNGIEYLKITPIKQWSTLTLQLYMLWRGIPVNPLYTMGFYRLGCYICPSLRNWEILLINNTDIFEEVRRDEVYREFIERRSIG